ncbi:MAG: hypothetical protein LBG43_03445 [Treponema sp.]|nr:hypothetical protein [Treponema sp.]
MRHESRRRIVERHEKNERHTVKLSFLAGSMSFAYTRQQFITVVTSGMILMASPFMTNK